ncbi:MAG: cysteine peptidase family C39 domain-containing protein [Bacillota bacterium]|nr:cysteine peptidase family C39 domain-containing protein [Bacillota bacterium]
MEHPVYQSQKMGCGYAAVKMMIIHHSKDDGYRYLPEPCADLKAPSLDDLINYAGESGLHLRAYRIDDPLNYFLKEAPYPQLVLVNEDGLSHLLYLRRVEPNKKEAVLFDPARGKRRMSLQGFLSIYAGISLEATGYLKAPAPKKPPRVRGILGNALAILAQSLSFILLFLGFYFVNGEREYPWALSFFLLFALSIPLQRLLLRKQMEQFDRRYLRKLDKIDISARKEAYANYLSYKGHIFKRAPNVAASFLLLGGFFLLLALNDVYMGFSILFLCLAYLFERRFIRPKLEKKKAELASLENELYRSVRTNPLAHEISQKAYRLSDAYALESAVFLFLSICLALASSLLNGVVELNYLLFCLMGMGLLREQLEKLSESLSPSTEYQLKHAYFLQHFAC